MASKKRTKDSGATSKSSQHGVTGSTVTRDISANDEDSLVGATEPSHAELLDFEIAARKATGKTKPSAAKATALAKKLAAKEPNKTKGAPLDADRVALYEEEAKLMTAKKPKVLHGYASHGTLLSAELFEALCVAVGNGESIHRLTQRPDMPNRETFFRQCRTMPERATRYAEALALRGEKLADEIVDLSDEAMYAASPEEAQAYRLRVDARKWVASRLLPRKYGDKMVVEGNAENPIVTQLVLGGDALAARIKGMKTINDAEGE